MEEASEYPLLSYPNLMLLLMRLALAGPATLEAALERLRGDLARVQESLPVPAEDVCERMRRALVYLYAAGLLEKGAQEEFRITARGEAVLREHPDGIDDSVLLAFDEFRRFLRRHAGRPPVEPADTVFDAGHAAFTQGGTPADNPYDFDTAEHLAWENGWFEALDEARGTTVDNGAGEGSGGAEGAADALFLRCLRTAVALVDLGAQHVADRAHGLDQTRVGRIVLDLLADARDQHVDAAVEG